MLVNGILSGAVTLCRILIDTDVAYFLTWNVQNNDNNMDEIIFILKDYAHMHAYIHTQYLYVFCIIQMCII